MIIPIGLKSFMVSIGALLNRWGASISVAVSARSNVDPSAGDLATNAVDKEPPAPGLLSTKKDCPSCSLNEFDKALATKSGAPPATKPTTILTGLLGYP